MEQNETPTAEPTYGCLSATDESPTPCIWYS